MPRVSTKKKSNRGAALHCIRCGKKIKPGSTYYTWAFFRSSAKTKCEACGYPKPSELTQSKLSAVYAAQEGVDLSALTTKDDIAEALREIATAAEEVRDEYGEAADAMGSAGESGQSAERRDSLETYADELNSAADEIEGAENDESESEEDFLESQRTRAQDAIDSLDC